MPIESIQENFTDFDLQRHCYMVNQSTLTIQAFEKSDDTKQSLDYTVEQLKTCLTSYRRDHLHRDFHVWAIHLLALSRFSSTLASYVAKKHEETPFWKRFLFKTNLNIFWLKTISKQFTKLFVQQNQKERREIQALTDQYKLTRSPQDLEKLGIYLQESFSDDAVTIAFFNQEVVRVLVDSPSPCQTPGKTLDKTFVQLALQFDPTFQWLHAFVQQCRSATKIQEVISFVTQIPLPAEAKTTYDVLCKNIALLQEATQVHSRAVLHGAFLLCELERKLCRSIKCEYLLEAFEKFLFEENNPELTCEQHARKQCLNLLLKRIHQKLSEEIQDETQKLFLQNAIVFFAKCLPDVNLIDSFLNLGLSFQAIFQLVGTLREIAKKFGSNLSENLKQAIIIAES